MKLSTIDFRGKTYRVGAGRDTADAADEAFDNIGDAGTIAVQGGYIPAGDVPTVAAVVLGLQDGVRTRSGDEDDARIRRADLRATACELGEAIRAAILEGAIDEQGVEV